MNSTAYRDRLQDAFHTEFHICVASTARDILPERAMLNDVVFPRIRERARESGVLMRESDPRWEATLAPQHTQQIRKAVLDDIYGYRPAFIGILERSYDARPAGLASLPWLEGIAGDAVVALDIIERVLADGLMRDRAFFYVLENRDTDADANADPLLEQLLERVRCSGCVVREGIADQEEFARLVLSDLEATFDRLYANGAHVPAAERDRRTQVAFADLHRR